MTAEPATRAETAPLARILVVDDDRALVGMLAMLLGESGYEVLTAYDGETAVRRAQDERPDLVLLDLHLPRLGGDDAVKRIRDETALPVIMLTGVRDSEEKARLLDLGADDYLTKPVSRAELLARVRAVLRGSARPRTQRAKHVVIGGLEVDPVAHVARVHGRELPLTGLELRLLACLAREPNLVTRVTELLGAGWPDLRDPDASWLRGPLHRLRGKLAEGGATCTIENIRGIGYRLVVA